MKWTNHTRSFLAAGAALFFSAVVTRAATADLSDLSIQSGIESGKAHLTIEGILSGAERSSTNSLYATTLREKVIVHRDRADFNFSVSFQTLQGGPREIILGIVGDGEIESVVGDGLEDWSVRRGTNGARSLVLRALPQTLASTNPPFQVEIEGRRLFQALPLWIVPLILTPQSSALFNGYVTLEADAGIEAKADQSTGLIPLERDSLPAEMRPEVVAGAPKIAAFRFFGGPYTMLLKLSFGDPEAVGVVLRDFKLVGTLTNENAVFTWTATASVKDPEGGTALLLSGLVGLMEVQIPGGRLRFDLGGYQAEFDGPGEYPIRLTFSAAVREAAEGWNTLSFYLATSPLAPVILRGLGEETRFRFAGAAEPIRSGNDFLSSLPSSGQVDLSWKEARSETEGKLFYALESLEQVSVSPGLMRQVALLDFKVTQGEISRVEMVVRGQGEITQVQGPQLLSWNVAPIPNSTDRRLTAQLNQPQKEGFALQIQAQTALGAFPQTTDALEFRPEGATRSTGYLQLVNDGAVSLEVTRSTGLTQISPEQFPENNSTRALFRATAGQKFAYRFSGGDFSMRFRADQVLPEVNVSETLDYHAGENEASIDAELEFEIREAPLREVLLRVPKGYSLARLTASGLGDYFLTEPAGEPDASLRLVYGQPISGRQLAQLRLERNWTLPTNAWVLPRLEVSGAKSTRGSIGVSAGSGIRLAVESADGLTETATAFFPKKTVGLQSAFRVNDASWQARIRLEHIPQTVRADALHLFSVGQGVAYGSSVVSYTISGAPVASFEFELSPEYFNIEFSGKEVRGWQKSARGYTVQLQSPVSGAYTLLASYERPFKPQGETLSFTGARPLGAQSEQGYTLVVSAYQFQVHPTNVSAGLSALEPGEVPPQYRLFFDAPILAAYHYTSRPFNLSLELSPLAQGDSISQFVDRASLATRISKQGQVLTDAKYLVKSRGHPNFQVALPRGTELWSVTVDGAAVVPVIDGSADLIPLPDRGAAGGLVTVDLQMASRSPAASRLAVHAPVLLAPVMFADWTLQPDAGQRLIYRQGSLSPTAGAPDVSGFAQWAGLLSQGNRANLAALAAGAILLLLAASKTRSGIGDGRGRWGWLPLASARLAALAGLLMAAGVLWVLGSAARSHSVESRIPLAFRAPVQPAGSDWMIEVSNVEDRWTLLTVLALIWPLLVAALFTAFLWLRGARSRRFVGEILCGSAALWCSLRWPNGAFPSVLAAAALLLYFTLPGLWRLFTLKRARDLPPPGSGAATASSAAAFLLMLGGVVWCCSAAPARGAEPIIAPPATRKEQAPSTSPLAESVRQKALVKEGVVRGTVQIRWRAIAGERLPILFEPAVLTRILYPTNALKLALLPSGAQRADQLIALASGLFDIEFDYQLPVAKQETGSGFILPTQFGLVNSIELTFEDLDVEVESAQAVSVERNAVGAGTVAQLTLTPANGIWIGWKPRSRDARREKPLFYAQFVQLEAPAAGVIEGAHQVSIRPAQGEIEELIFDVPEKVSITDVTGSVPEPRAASPTQIAQAAAQTSLVSLWRFDPDTRKLRVKLSPAQSRPFALQIRSQLATGEFPYEQTIGLLSVEGAQEQIGLLGIATGGDVQLDNVVPNGLSPVNLEDFPAPAVAALPVRGITVRRAFRYGQPDATATLKAMAVEPDIRVQTQETVSLGEDRTLLVSSPAVTIARAGIFQLTFDLPAGFEVESISGPALSHWTEAPAEAGRRVTLHLKDRTEGTQSFAITLSGAGVRSTNGWTAPRALFREAAKEQGTLVIAPEQGMRLQPQTRNGLTLEDPVAAGVTQRGVLLFNILQAAWSLTLDIEQLDSWVEAASVQQASIGEAQVKVSAAIQYQINNTGLRSLRLLIPTNAENVHFQGNQISDFRPAPGFETNGLRLWEIKLDRRTIGAYNLQASYQTPLSEQSSEVTLRGIEAVGVNVQRGFVTIDADGRLQVTAPSLPAALQPAEWQSIPRPLLQGLPASSAALVYRLAEPRFSLVAQLQRHDAAKLLPARVVSAAINSVVADDGAALTQVRLEMVQGDKRLLAFTLPPGARFWFAQVNEQGVLPWRDQDRLLIPLENTPSSGNNAVVEIFYNSQSSRLGERPFDLEAPKFDLPLENIVWQIDVNEKWRITRQEGSLQLAHDEVTGPAAAMDWATYIQAAQGARQNKRAEAEAEMNSANASLQQGKPAEARREFQAAFDLSSDDGAFNEDARVQLHNLKLQQALIGLNVQRASQQSPGPSGSGGARTPRALNYTQQEVQQLIDHNSPDDNTALIRLAERIIQQQEAAVRSPSAMTATLPREGRIVEFRRAVAVDSWADLKLRLEAKPSTRSSSMVHGAALAVVVIWLALLALAGRKFRRLGTAGG